MGPDTLTVNGAGFKETQSTLKLIATLTHLLELWLTFLHYCYLVCVLSHFETCCLHSVNISNVKV